MTITVDCSKYRKCSAHLREEGKKVFRELGGFDVLSRSTWEFEVPERKDRSEGELVEEARELAVNALHKRCREQDIRISINDFKRLNSHDYLEIRY